MSLPTDDSYSSLHKFLTIIVSFLRKEHKFADKDIQNNVFVPLREKNHLSKITDTHDFTDAISALYDLI